MSTASPLPLQPLPESVVSAHEQLLLKQEVAARLEQHRRRRPLAAGEQRAAEMAADKVTERPRSRQGSRVADSVAARFAQSVSYRDFLAQEAEAAMRQAGAVAEVARRNADAIAAAQQRLLQDIAHWNEAGIRENMNSATAFHSYAHASALPAEISPFAEPASSVEVHAQATESFTEAQNRPSAKHASVAPEQVKQSLLTGAEWQAKHSTQQVFAEVLAQAITASSTIASTGTVSSSLTEELPFGSSTSAAISHLSNEPLETPTGLPTNLIEFPRQLVAARKARPRLAEGPLREEADHSPERAQLRIFEVEADTFSTMPLTVTESILPEWSNIRLDSWQAPHETTVPDAQVSLALPLYTAAVGSRCMAAAVDACCILVAFLMAVAVASYASPELPTGLAAMAAAVGSLAMLGVLYLVFFFTFTDATPGMRYARIALCTFNDDNPTRPAMRRRLLAMLLSAVPLGLGFAWALLDDDRLGWHDRVSRMYQRQY